MKTENEILDILDKNIIVISNNGRRMKFSKLFRWKTYPKDVCLIYIPECVSKEYEMIMNGNKKILSSKMPSRPYYGAFYHDTCSLTFSSEFVWVDNCFPLSKYGIERCEKISEMYEKRLIKFKEHFKTLKKMMERYS